MAQVKIIVDTDFGLSGDDLGALSMLHYYIDKGDCELLGIMSATNDKYAVPAIDAFNRYYKHSNIPIGARKNKTDIEDGFYNRLIAATFPHELDFHDVPDVVDLYRKILTGQEDKSVTLVILGPMLNIKRLLESKPDTWSELNGLALVQKKVKEAVIMGGQFPEGKGEWNFKSDGPGVTRFVVQNLNVPIVFSGFEVGEVIKTGEILNEMDKNTPLYQGFLFYSEHAPWMKQNFKGKILPNSSFDQTAVLYAVNGGIVNYWEKINDGYCEVEENGDNRWIRGKDANQAYLKLIKPAKDLAKIIEAAMLHMENGSQ